MNIIVGRDVIDGVQIFEDVSASMCFVEDVYFGAVFAPVLGKSLCNVTIYNMEPLYDDCPSFSIGYWDVLKHCRILDYSKSNVEYLQKRGIPAFHQPYGYHESLTRIKPDKQDIDVLFFGTETPRRAELLSDLSKEFNFQWVGAHPSHKVPGKELDAIVARAQVHLNIHHGIPQRLEVSRVNYLLANHCTVVSEKGSEPEVNALYENALYFTTLDELSMTIRHALKNPRDGYEFMKKLPTDCTAANKWLREISNP